MQNELTEKVINRSARYSKVKTILGKRRKALGLAGVIALACGASTGWVDEPAYQTAAPAEVPSGAVKGLVLLVSFSDEQISDEQARRIWRRINEKGYPNGESGVVATGSLTDYLADMSTPSTSSGPLLDLTSDVVHVRLSETKAFYDEDKADDFNVPRNAFDIEGTLTKITAPGPATALLRAAACKLTGCDSVPVEYDVVTASSVTTYSAPYSFKDLTTRTFSYWPDAMLRDNFGRRSLGRDFDIPKIETFAYLGIVYAGTPSFGGGRGLWPRSVATPGTTITGADVSTRAARFFITGTYGTDSTPLGTLAHESVHTLFDLPDLYDGGEEVGMSTSDPISSGIGSHGLLGSPSVGHALGTWEEPQNMEAPLRDRLGWANIIDLNNLPEGTRVELAANGVDVARYCREDSATNECFYLEARHTGSPRSARGCSEGDCTLESPAEGLVIWHTENLKNAMDYVVNNHEDTTANIHNQVVLVEAQGTSELLKPRGSVSINYADHYFRAGGVDRFDNATPASSRWWDGTPSGLNIDNVSSPGATMSFELGARPMSRVFADSDPHVQVQVGASDLPLGETTQLTTTGEASWQYDVHIFEKTGVSSAKTQSHIGVTGVRSFPIRGVEGDTHVEIVSYPSAGNPAAASARFHAFMAEGTVATTYAADALEFSGMERMVQRQNQFVTLQPGRDVGFEPGREPDVAVNVPEAGGHALWVAKAQPGYMLTSLEAYRVGDSERQSVTSSGAGELKLSVDVSAAVDGGDAEYVVLVNAEPIPGRTCASGMVEPFRAEKVLNDVGDLVRHNDAIYSSNVPRNLLWSNFSNGALVSGASSNPQNSPTSWTPVAVCGEYQASCSGLPEWKLEGNALPSTFVGDVVFNGARYSFVGSDINEVPGAFASKQVRSGVEMFAEVDPEYPLESNRLFVYHDSASWQLQGQCADPAVADRATVVTGDGIGSVTSSLGSKTVRTNEPVVVNNTSAQFELGFALRSGFALDQVLIDGQAQNISSSATSLTVPAASGNQPRFIELRTRPL